MNKTPLFLRFGAFILGKGFDFDMWATPEIPETPTQIPGAPVDPPSQIAWIPTASRLPELYKEVTIYTTDKEILHGWARVNDWDYIHSKDNRTVNNVSHWMEIRSPNIDPPVKSPQVSTQQPSQIASNKPRMPR